MTRAQNFEPTCCKKLITPANHLPQVFFLPPQVCSSIRVSSCPLVRIPHSSPRQTPNSHYSVSVNCIILTLLLVKSYSVFLTHLWRLLPCPQCSFLFWNFHLKDWIAFHCLWSLFCYPHPRHPAASAFWLPLRVCAYKYIFEIFNLYV